MTWQNWVSVSLSALVVIVSVVGIIDVIRSQRRLRSARQKFCPDTVHEGDIRLIQACSSIRDVSGQLDLGYEMVDLEELPICPACQGTGRRVSS